ncbi:MAG TPA: dihydrofolate reductase family protein [Methanomassiliicoccales archaeon]|nr:dihydrofolate reductase family protein [Methanomassiliicoccales archaeon]HPR98340.1 dihydrofolate reductase family protein [Methanomassiliicoccales archaeon]HSA35646.1 dihydrofolate reductase family protein [Methanomassiliicoccales archaeon]
MKDLRVVLHIQTSLDARVTGFEIDMGAHYQLAETFEPDGTISGADTFLAAPIPDEVPEWSYEAAKNFPSCSRSVMAIVDSKGRVRNWSAIKRQPFWKTPVALCSRSTPEEYLQYLKGEGIDIIIAGKDHVDLKKALKELQSRYGLRTLRIDSGGTLSAIMLKEGLVDEISVILSPCVVGNQNSAQFIDPSVAELPKPCQLKLGHVEELENGLVWLKYEVIRKGKR